MTDQFLFVGGPADGLYVEIRDALPSVRWNAPAPTSHGEQSSQPEPSVVVYTRREVWLSGYHVAPLRFYAVEEMPDREAIALMVGSRAVR